MPAETLFSVESSLGTMETDHDIYPMPLFVQLTVADLDASADFYEALGFDVIYSMPVMAHVRYRKYADVMLVADQTDVGEEGESEKKNRREGLSIYLTVENESVDDVAERATDFGAEVANGPYDTPWNTREVAIVDPDGFELVFSEQADSDRSFEDVMESARMEE